MIHITEYHCFHEQGYYAPGDTGAPVYDTAAGRIGVAICYDRHYPEYMRALALEGAELVIVPQAGSVGEWPAGLYEAEMQVAAFQNGYFTALCNRVGPEECLDLWRRVVRLRTGRSRAGARRRARGDDPLRRHRPQAGSHLARAAALPSRPPPGPVWRLARPLAGHAPAGVELSRSAG